MSDRTRVLFVQGGGERAGAEVALLGRVAHLQEQQVDATVAFLSDGPFRHEVARRGIPTVLVMDELPRARYPWRLPRVVRAADRAIHRSQADVVEACGEKMSALVGVITRWHGPPVIYNLQDAPRRDVASSALQAVARTGSHDTVVVPSQWMARAFAASWRFEPIVIPNTVPVPESPPGAADLGALTGWPPDALVVGLFGRLVGWKGADVLLAAAAALRKDLPQLRFLLVGGELYGRETGFAARLGEQVSRLGIEDRVHFAGHHDDPLALMAACHMICHCSTKPEPFGVVVAEAMLLERAVIATRTGGPEEMLVNGESGLLVRPGEPAALADALASLAADPARRARLGVEAGRRARRSYASQAIAGPLAELYREVARRGSVSKARR